ncbi:MAG: hypothetical protein SOY65_04245 [Marinifilaceae bacterium]|nr:hypothetical protein [Marinifilaceae bacterium]
MFAECSLAMQETYGELAGNLQGSKCMKTEGISLEYSDYLPGVRSGTENVSF